MLKTLTIDEVALRIGKSSRTVRSDMVRRPGSIPQWFKLPGAKKPLWLESTVDAFVMEHAINANAVPRTSVTINNCLRNPPRSRRKGL